MCHYSDTSRCARVRTIGADDGHYNATVDRPFRWAPHTGNAQVHDGLVARVLRGATVHSSNWTATGDEMLARSAMDARRSGRTRHMLTGLTSWIIILAAASCLIRFPRSWLIVTAVCIGLFLLRVMMVLAYAILSDGACRVWGCTDWSQGEDVPQPDGLSPTEVRHVVPIPDYKEPASLLRRTLDTLAQQHRASERLIVVLGMEERELDAVAKGELLAHEYGTRLLDVLVTTHPAGLPGEGAPGKSSNQAWHSGRLPGASRSSSSTPIVSRSPRATPTRSSTSTTSPRSHGCSPRRRTAICASGKRLCSTATASGASLRLSASAPGSARRGCMRTS